MAGLAFIATALGFLLLFWLIAEVGPSRATVVTYINPLVAVLPGVMLLSEPFTLGIAAGLPLILVGWVLGTAPSRKAPSRNVPADDDREGKGAAGASARVIGRRDVSPPPRPASRPSCAARR